MCWSKWPERLGAGALLLPQNITDATSLTDGACVSKNMKRGKRLARSQLHSRAESCHISSPPDCCPSMASAVDLGATVGEKCMVTTHGTPTCWAHQDLSSSVNPHNLVQAFTSLALDEEAEVQDLSWSLGHCWPRSLGS